MEGHSAFKSKRLEKHEANSSQADVAELDTRVQDVIETVRRADLRHPPSLDRIAEQLGISSFRLRHLFKEQVGVPFSIYLRHVRLLQAKNLLETTFLRVKEVAAAVGIQDLSHFVRDYKATFGENPLQTTKQSRRKTRPTVWPPHTS